MAAPTYDRMRAIALPRLALAKGPLRRKDKFWDCGRRHFSPRTVAIAISEGDARIVNGLLVARAAAAAQAANLPLALGGRR